MPSATVDAPVVPIRPAPKLAHGGRSGLPPVDRGGGGGGGGEGGGDGGEFRRDELPFSAAKLGMALVLFSLSVLFLVTVAVSVNMRRQQGAWPPPGMPGLPRILWANTLVLLASSVTLRLGVRAIARDRREALVRGLAVTTGLGTLFLVGQATAWHGYLAQGVTLASGVHGRIFYWLTGLHAAHVVGGVVVLAVCLARAALGRYSSARRVGVELAELYWHFLGAVWLALVLMLEVML